MARTPRGIPRSLPHRRPERHRHRHHGHQPSPRRLPISTIYPSPIAAGGSRDAAPASCRASAAASASSRTCVRDRAGGLFRAADRACWRITRCTAAIRASGGASVDSAPTAGPCQRERPRAQPSWRCSLPLHVGQPTHSNLISHPLRLSAVRNKIKEPAQRVATPPTFLDRALADGGGRRRYSAPAAAPWHVERAARWCTSTPVTAARPGPRRRPHGWTPGRRGPR